MTGAGGTRRLLELCDQALELPADERAAFLDAACDGDAALRRRVESVLGAVTRADDAMPENALGAGAAAALVGGTVGDYRLQSLIGEGGMGAVYEAERDIEGGVQRVAVKVIRGGLAAGELLRRFDIERRILAGLNHPYIAQLIDGGNDAGTPYLVMEYVDGVPVDRYLDERRAGVAERIRMLQKIALAVHAAHQSLVVHRDLKPSNVLVTGDGIPKLLDFGIAKLLDAADGPGADATVLGRQAMTPDYASPEQILDNTVTTASDVYSLGVLAYEVLAGERPYRVSDDSRRALVASVDGRKVPPASTRLDGVASASRRAAIAAARATTPERLRRTLRGDLDTILAKALAREPEARYPSVAAFSADLGRFVDGQPVEARPASIGYRAARFAGRHRTAVAFSAALLLSLVGGLVVTGRLYLQAEAARADAAARFEQVRTLAATMMFDVYDDLASVPGTATARTRIAETAQDYLGSLTAGADTPDDVLLDAGRGYARLYSILNREAVNDAASRSAARMAYEQADALLSSLAARPDATAPDHRALGRLRLDRGADLVDLENAPGQALPVLQSAAVAFDAARALDEGDAGLEAERLSVSVQMADALKWQQDYPAALAELGAALERIQAARERWPAAPELARLAGDARQLSGEVRYFQEDYAGALTDYGHSIAGYRQALEIGGNDSAVTAALGVAHWSRGNTLIDMDRPGDAAIDYGVAIEHVGRVVERDPDDASSARRLAILKGSRAMALVRSGEADAAIALMREAGDWFEAQAAADPDTPQAQRSLAISHHMMGDIYHYAERPGDACTWYRRALDTWRDIDARFGISAFDAGQPDFLRELMADCD